MSALTLGPVCLGFSLWKMHPPSWCGVSPPRPGKCCIGPDIKSQGLFSQGPRPLNSWNSWLTGVSPKGAVPAELIYLAGGSDCSPMGCGGGSEDKDSHCPLRLGRPAGAQAPPRLPQQVGIPEFCSVRAWGAGSTS